MKYISQQITSITDIASTENHDEITYGRTVSTIFAHRHNLQKNCLSLNKRYNRLPRSRPYYYAPNYLAGTIRAVSNLFSSNIFRVHHECNRWSGNGSAINRTAGNISLI